MAGTDESQGHFWCSYQEESWNGARTLFWEDVWFGKRKLAEVFPRLYDITFSRMVTVRKVVGEGCDSVTFRRTLHGETLAQWEEMKSLVGGVVLNEDNDKLIWILNKKNKFVVKELYMLLKSSPLVGFRGIWKLRMPLKIKIFLWLMIKKKYPDKR